MTGHFSPLLMSSGPFLLSPSFVFLPSSLFLLFAPYGAPLVLINIVLIEPVVLNCVTTSVQRLKSQWHYVSSKVLLFNWLPGIKYRCLINPPWQPYFLLIKLLCRPRALIVLLARFLAENALITHFLVATV